MGLKKKHPAIGAGGGGAPTPGSEVAHSHGAVAILGSKGSSKVFFIQRQNGRSWHHRNINGSGFSSTVAESQWKIVQPCLIFEGQFKEKKHGKILCRICTKVTALPISTKLLEPFKVARDG